MNIVTANLFKSGQNVKNKEENLRLSPKLQCDSIRWEQLAIRHFSRGYNFRTNNLIFILKTHTRPYTYLEKVIICLEPV